MASIYRRTKDKGRKGACWFITYRDHRGKRTTSKGFSDRGATEKLAVHLEEEARMVRVGLKRVPDSVERQPIAEVIAMFRQYLRDRDASDRYVEELAGKVERITSGCGVTAYSQIKADDVERYLAKLRAEGLSKQTSNHYLRAIRQFCRWLVRTKRLREDPTVEIEMLNVQTDRRHDRRALLPDEFARLVAAAEEGPSAVGLPGPDRAAMYLLAACTGYRRGCHMFVQSSRCRVK